MPPTVAEVQPLQWTAWIIVAANRCDVAKPEPRRGDVESVEPAGKGQVRIRLHGYPYTFIARPTIRSTDTGPELAELTIISDEDHVVDYEALRAIPARRLAYTAAQHLDPRRRPTLAGRRWRHVDPNHVETFAAHTAAPFDARVVLAAALAEHAQTLGLPIRATVAEELGVSKRTADRLLKRAKAEGLLEDRPLPRRPPPRQRDTTE